jgi:hypothetical protein
MSRGDAWLALHSLSAIDWKASVAQRPVQGKEGCYEMPCGIHARQLLDALACRLGLQSALLAPDLPSAKISGADRDELKRRIKAASPDAGTLLYIASLGVVAAAVVVVFFGLGFSEPAGRNRQRSARSFARLCRR